MAYKDQWNLATDDEFKAAGAVAIVLGGDSDSGGSAGNAEPHEPRELRQAGAEQPEMLYAALRRQLRLEN